MFKARKDNALKMHWNLILKLGH